ncbi:MAG: NAD-binding protein [Desulfobacterales bacterium]|nr:NAD-binding protein [Desulfobacterales bacterium]MDX2509113.1 NAD-binding protein [Desulfobacterales bacterium]
MHSIRRVIFAFLLITGAISIGVSGYMIIEDYTFFEGFYMSVITLTTVGFGEVKPLSGAGRGFTTFYILLGFGSLALAGHAIAESLLEKVFSGRSGLKKMRKKISALKSHYIICGYGRVGAAASEYFEKAGIDFVTIEANPEHCQIINEKGSLYIEGDATRESLLLEAGIKSAKGLLALLNSDPDNLFIVLSARELNPTLHIIARAGEPSSGKKIMRAGADSVVSPFSTAGRQIAADILAVTGKKKNSAAQPMTTEVLPKWISVQEDSDTTGETIGAVSEKTERQVIGLRKNNQDSIFPDPSIKLEPGDKLLVLDAMQNKADHSIRRSGRKKIVIVDNNPVFLRLYTRLFQKAGFHPITATNGPEGVDTIIREKPAAAVIDYILPELSGIEVCQRIRTTHECHGIKLIIFTADNQAKTQRRAIDAGVDAVIVKSPEASEVIKTVVRMVRSNPTT